MRGAPTSWQRLIWLWLGTAALCVSLIVGCVTPEPMMLVEPSPGAMGVEDEVLSGPVVDVDSAETTPPAPGTVAGYAKLESTVHGIQVDVAELQTAQDELDRQVTSLGGRVDAVESETSALSQTVLGRLDDLDATLQTIGAKVGVRPTTDMGGSPSLGGRDVEAEVALAVDVWRSAWEKEDLAAYMALYDASAKVQRIRISDGGRGAPKNLVPAGLRAHMERLFRRYDHAEVVVQGFRVVQEGSNMAATFEQDYSAFSKQGDLQPVYADKGVKTLIFTEKDGRWVIAEEKWAPLRR